MDGSGTLGPRGPALGPEISSGDLILAGLTQVDAAASRADAVALGPGTLRDKGGELEWQ